MNHEELITRLLGQLKNRLVPQREQPYHDQIRRARAIRNSVNDRLKPVGWNADYDGVRPYLIDPLGERIPQVWGDLLFGEDPGISPVSASDKKKMDDMLRFNKFSSKLRRAEEMCSAEGEVWYRIMPNEAFGHAQIEFHSRLVVVPLWMGEHAMAAAFVSELERGETSGNKWVLRMVEIHAKGFVKRYLFKGPQQDDFKLGVLQDFGSYGPLEGVEETEVTGLEPLFGRLTNRLGDDPHMGISDYEGIDDLLMALNEATTVGQENMRLTAKQRAILPQRFLDLAGNFPKGQEILVATEVDQDPEKIKNQVAMIEFEFDAAALIAYKNDLTDTILTRARIAPQLVGRHTEGAQTGPAMRARLIDSELAQQGKGKVWDDEAPVTLHRMVQVEKKLLGIKWSKTDEPPTFKRASALPEDPEARSRRLAVSVNSEFLSRKTAIAKDNPEWDDRRVEEEMAQIEKETGMGQIEAPDSKTDPSTLRTPATRRVQGKTPPSAETAAEKKERSNATGK